MKNIDVLVFENPDANCLRLTGEQLLRVANRIYSKEVTTQSSFFFNVETGLILALLTQQMKNSTDDHLYFIEDRQVPVFELMKNAFISAGKSFQGKFTFVEVEHGKVKAINQTMGIFDEQIHYTNLLPLVGSSINAYLDSIKC